MLNVKVRAPGQTRPAKIADAAGGPHPGGGAVNSGQAAPLEILKS